MSKLKCINKDCISYNKEIFVNKISFRFNKITGKLDPFGRNSICNDCGQLLESVEENKGVPNIYLTDFKQLSTEDKKIALKKRADKHNQTKMKDKVHHIRQKFGLK